MSGVPWVAYWHYADFNDKILTVTLDLQQYLQKSWEIHFGILNNVESVGENCFQCFTALSLDTLIFQYYWTRKIWNTHHSTELWYRKQPMRQCKRKKTCGDCAPEPSPDQNKLTLISSFPSTPWWLICKEAMNTTPRPIPKGPHSLEIRRPEWRYILLYATE